MSSRQTQSGSLVRSARPGPEAGEIGKLIVEVLDGLKVANSDEGNAAVEAAVRSKVVALTDRFPMYDYIA